MTCESVELEAEANLVHFSIIQGLELCLAVFIKNAFNSELHSNTYKRITFKLCITVMINMTTLSSFIPISMTFAAMTCAIILW